MTDLPGSASTMSRSGWKTAWGALADAVKGPKYLPQTYFALFALNAVPAFVRLGHDWTADMASDELSMAELADFGIGLAVLLAMLPFWIGLLRFFSGARDIYPEGLAGLSLRLIGWVIALSVSFIVAIMVVMLIPIPLVTLLALDQTASELVMAAFWIAGFAVLFWIMLRLTTFPSNLALREPAPLRTGFRETRGSVWYLLRAWLCLVVMVTIVVAIVLAVMALVLGVAATDFGAFAALSIQRQDILPRAVLSLLAGFWGTLFISWEMAFLGRAYRTIRGV